jgi:hypothetical protein
VWEIITPQFITYQWGGIITPLCGRSIILPVGVNIGLLSRMGEFSIPSFVKLYYPLYGGFITPPVVGEYISLSGNHFAL